MADINFVASRCLESLVRLLPVAFMQVIGLAVDVAAVLAYLAIGYGIARLLAWLADAAARLVRLDAVLQRSRLVRSSRPSGIERSMPSLAGCTVFWLTMWMFTVGGIDLFLSLLAFDGRVTPGALMNAVAPMPSKGGLPLAAPVSTFGPGLLVAAALLLLGLWSAGLPRRLMAASASRAGWAYVRPLANGCYLAWMMALAVSALELLGLELGLFKYLVLIAFAAATFGLGLAFGLGGKDVTAGIVAGHYTRRRLKPGDHVVVVGIEGTIREVGPVATVIETDEDGLMKRRSVPNTVMIAEAVH